MNNSLVIQCLLLIMIVKTKFSFTFIFKGLGLANVTMDMGSYFFCAILIAAKQSCNYFIRPPTTIKHLICDSFVRWHELVQVMLISGKVVLLSELRKTFQRPESTATLGTSKFSAANGT